MLAPNQQLWLDLGHLIRDQVPDSDGHTLPPDTMAGSYELRDLDHATVGQLYEGKLVVDKTYGHAAYGCGDCCGYSIPELVPDSYAGPPDDSYDEVMQCTEQCGGEVVDVADAATNWKSSNTAVATLPNSTLRTVASGTTTGSAQITLQGTHPAPQCPTMNYYPTQGVGVQPQITSIDPNPIMIGSTNQSLTINGSGFGTSPTVSLPSGFTSTGQGSTDTQIILTGVSVAYSATVGNNNVTVTNVETSPAATLGVDGPYHMIVESDVTGKCSGCSTTVERDVTYQVQNFSGTAANTTWIGETPVNSGWSCTQSQPTIDYSPCSDNYLTSATGTFADAWSLQQDGYTPANCGFTTVDTWQWCKHSPSQTLGVLTGYLHNTQIEINGVVSPSQMPTGTVVPF